MCEGIPERNRQILQMRKEGLSQREVAQKFGLSPSRIYLIERRDAADRLMAKRCAKLREKIRVADDLDRMWPVEDLIDAAELIVVTKKRLLDHFKQTKKDQISLQELMDMCLDAPVDALDFMMSPLLRVRGVGKKGFWSVVDGLTDLDMGSQCNDEWRTKLAMVK
jgi:transcriptional regulator